MSRIDDTWATRELPILAAAYRRVEAGDVSIGQLQSLGEELGIDPKTLLAGVQALASASPPYIDVQLAMGWGADRYGGGYVLAVSERARRELGAWPTPDSLADQLVAALLVAADRAENQDDAERLREAAGDLGSSVVKGVLVSLFTRFVTTGLPE